jgi:hypothetical protein
MATRIVPYDEDEEVRQRKLAMVKKGGILNLFTL